MTKKRILPLLALIILSLVLTACGTIVPPVSWPGVTPDETSGLAYVAYNQHVYAVQLENGLERWRFPAEVQGDLTLFAAPQLTTEGQLIVAGYNHKLYSLNPENGLSNWSFSGAGNRFIAAPLAGSGLVYAPNSDHLLYTLNADGRLEWTFPTQEPQWSQPVSDGEVVYLPSMDHFVYAIDAQSGEELWSVDLGGTIVGTPTLSEDGILYIGTLNKTVFAVNTQSGRVAWSFATQGWAWGGPTLVDGQLIVADFEGFVYALDAARGDESWRVDTGAAITGSPVLFNDSLYVVNEGGKILSLTLDGRSRELALPEAYAGPLYGSPVVAGDLLLIGLANNAAVVIALDADGNVVWNFTPVK